MRFALHTLYVFHQSMSAVTAEVTKQMMQQWREQVHQSGGKGAAEIDMLVAFNDLTSKINGRVAFGTSHQDVEVVALMREMQKLATAATLDPPILWYRAVFASTLYAMAFKILNP